MSVEIVRLVKWAGLRCLITAMSALSWPKTPVLAENFIPQRIGQEWTCNSLPSRILAAFLGGLPVLFRDLSQPGPLANDKRDELDRCGASGYVSSNSPSWFTGRDSIGGQLAGSRGLESAPRLPALDESS